MSELVCLAALDSQSWTVLTFVLYMAAVFLLAFLSHRFLRGRSFLKEYFLGSRGLGVWALALTYAATSASGGSFTGFPSLIYQHGWILALWISSYMVVPVCCMGLLGKRLNQVARKTGAITLGDILRDRYGDPRLGVLIALLLAFFLGFNLVAQFKAGGVIVQVMLEGQPAFEAAAGGMEWWARTFSFLSGANQPSSQYCLGLLLFAFGVVIYTAYGGFRAVVWTDVLQGVVMLAGVLILLPLAIWKAGGLETATQDLASRVTPRVGEVSLALEGGASEPVTLPADSPIRLERDGRTHAFRTVGAVELLPGAAAAAIAVRAEAPEELPAAAWSSADPEAGRAIIEGAEAPRLRVEAFRVSGRRSLASGPGPSASSLDGFLPLGLALSFFVMWAITGAGQPGTLVRLMAFRDARVFRRAIFVATIYYSLIYIPLVVIFVCARSVLPDLAEPDQAMPAMVTFVAPGVLAGILLAAPFAAVMSTVDSFLLIISSNLVRDVYQRTFRPNASSRRIRIGSYLTTVVVGVLVTVAATNPPRFLQDLIVFSTAGMACSFLAPMLMAMYWKRSTAAGIYASILAGFLTIVGLYGVNWVLAASVGPYNFAGVLPAVWGLLVSAAAGVVVSLLTRPPRRELVDLYFSARRPPQERCG